MEHGWNPSTISSAVVGDVARSGSPTHVFFRIRGAFLHAASVGPCPASSISILKHKKNHSRQMPPHLLKSRLERRPLPEELDIRHEALQPRPAQRLQRLPALLRRVRPDVALEQDDAADQERRHRDVRDRRLPHHEPRVPARISVFALMLRVGFGEEVLEPLERVEAAARRLADGEEAEEGHDDLGVEVVYEVARAGAQDGVRGEEARGGEEVRDELDDHRRLGERRGLGRGLVSAGRRATVRERWDLGREGGSGWGELVVSRFVRCYKQNTNNKVGVCAGMADGRADLACGVHFFAKPIWLVV